MKLSSSVLAQKRSYRARQKAAGRLAIAGRAKAFRLMMDIRRAVPCMDCGGSFAACAMDFDHRPSEDKVAHVSKLALSAKTHPVALAAEMNKCDVVCANCHRVRTVQRQWETN